MIDLMMLVYIGIGAIALSVGVVMMGVMTAWVILTHYLFKVD